MPQAEQNRAAPGFCSPHAGHWGTRSSLRLALRSQGGVASAEHDRGSRRLVWDERVDEVQGCERLGFVEDVDVQPAHLGEIALVDGSSRVRGTGLVFRDTLLDENAGSHIAYGQAFPGALDAAAGKNAHDLLALGLNVASLHTDMVIGGPEVNVDGLDRSGQPTPIIRDDTWVLP